MLARCTSNAEAGQTVTLTVNGKSHTATVGSDGTWQATLNATHSEVEFDSKMMYVDAYVNKADGMLVGPYSNYGPGFDYVGGTGWNSGKRKVDALDLFADGSYELFGRQHNLMFGGSYSKQNNRYFSSWANIFPDEIGSFYNFNGNFPQTDWSPQSPRPRCLPEHSR